MKKNIVLVLLLLICSGCFAAFGGCGAGNSKVVFKGNGGTLVSGTEVQNVVSLDKLTDIPVYEKVGYTFNGWNRDLSDPNKLDSGDVGFVIEAQWKAEQYTVFLDGDGADTPNDIDSEGYVFTFDAPVPTLPVVNKADVFFIGWYYEAEKVYISENFLWKYDIADGETVTLKAKYENFALVYNGIETTDVFETINPRAYGSESETFTLSNPQRKGWTFSGWSGTGIDGVSQAVTIEKGSTGAREYTAQWEQKTYTIRFDLGNGKIDGKTTYEPLTAHYGDKVYGKLPKPVPDDKDKLFKGWFYKNGENEFEITKDTLWGEKYDSTDITIYAKYVNNPSSADDGLWTDFY